MAPSVGAVLMVGYPLWLAIHGSASTLRLSSVDKGCPSRPVPIGCGPRWLDRSLVHGLSDAMTVAEQVHSGESNARRSSSSCQTCAAMIDCRSALARDCGPIRVPSYTRRDCPQVPADQWVCLDSNQVPGAARVKGGESLSRSTGLPIRPFAQSFRLGSFTGYPSGFRSPVGYSQHLP